MLSCDSIHCEECTIASQFSTLRLELLHRDRRTPAAYDMSPILFGVRHNTIVTEELLM